MKKEQLLATINENVKTFFQKLLIDKEFSTASIYFEFSPSASMNFILLINKEITYLSIFNLDDEVIDSIKKYFKTQFIQFHPSLGFKPDIEKWNKAVFEYFKDETLNTSYVWDQGLYIKKMKRAAYNFSHWVQGRLTTMMFEEGGFDKRKWHRATGEFWITNNNEVTFVGRAFNKRNTEHPININLDSWHVRESFIEHYEMTNHGLLKEFWKPWNKLTIRVFYDDYFRELEHTDYSLDNGNGIAEKIEGLPVE
ncbi:MULTISPECIES: hypothetical protein [unclassified Arcicella]|uniref:hypothetical protein n=1 Tax=unclassified Arcicella TaxID=2644986 RepID=UPI002867ABF9|nr:MULTISPECIES: hypothetical protein [unclassified Arcicella]MDR6563968.1 hypothetical protein [Arcicella sp. BE51]MDR6813721.1 hypothetical protein [Arcicella sp. BE140]MDR6825033.1 hypothetical protein [Arcicella sp. BE139]